MSVVKIAGVLGTSTKDWADAVNQAVSEASKSMNITGVEVLNTTCSVQNGKVTEYKANCNIAYTE